MDGLRFVGFFRLIPALLLSFVLGHTPVEAGPVIEEGIRLSFSPRGQNYFRANLNAVLLANQLDLSKSHWDRIGFVLNGPLEGHGLQNQLGSMYYGFPVRKPKIEVKLAGSDLRVQFKAIGAEIDPSGPSAYGFSRSKGVVILMRLEAENLQFDTKTLRLNDLANPGLFGVTGFDSISARSDGARTVKAELPILVEANGKEANMRVLAVRTNLQKTTLDFGFEKMVVPTIKVLIDGKEFPFDQSALETDIRSQLPQLSDALTLALKKYFEKDGKDLVQPSFDDLAKSLNIDFKLPLTTDSNPEKELLIKLRPKTTRYSRARHLEIGFNTEIVDEKSAEDRGIFPTVGEAGEVTLVGLDSTAYDVAMTLHPSAINGVLNRAWAKGVLRDIDMGKDEEGKATLVRIPQPPIVDLSPRAKPNEIRIHAWIGYVVRGISGVLFKGPIPIELDLIARAEANSKNEVELVLDHIDESTLKVDTRATWLSPIRGKVNQVVREKISKLNRSAFEKRQLLTSLPTLDELIEIPLILKSVTTESGNLVVLAEFAPKS